MIELNYLVKYSTLLAIILLFIAGIIFKNPVLVIMVLICAIIISYWEHKLNKYRE